MDAFICLERSIVSKGIYPKLDETIESFEAIVSGEADDLPEQAFIYVGGLVSVREKAATLK